MKAICAAVSALICLAGSAQAAALQACDLTVDVTDTDPHGTNVRATPGGKIIATLSDSEADGWIEADIIGQSGDWFLIDGAQDIGDDEKTIFRGRGYLHRSVLGAYGLWNGFPLWSDHDKRSPMVAKAASGDQEVVFLGCWGQFAKVRIKEGTGWTQTLCLNGRTTCP
jgi:hypothetical protein